MKALGIEDLTPINSESENAVYVLPSRGGIVGSFTPDLLEALEAKREVLGPEELERHLAVFVERWNRSNEPADTPVPEIPDEIDVLWIVHACPRGSTGARCGLLVAAQLCGASTRRTRGD